MRSLPTSQGWSCRTLGLCIRIWDLAMKTRFIFVAWTHSFGSNSWSASSDSLFSVAHTFLYDRYLHRYWCRWCRKHQREDRASLLWWCWRRSKAMGEDIMNDTMRYIGNLRLILSCQVFNGRRDAMMWLSGMNSSYAYVDGENFKPRQGITVIFWKRMLEDIFSQEAFHQFCNFPCSVQGRICVNMSHLLRVCN